MLLQIFLQTCNANSRTKSCISESYYMYDNPHSVYLCPAEQLRPTPAPTPPHPRRHQPGQLVYDLTLAPDVDQPTTIKQSYTQPMPLDMTTPPNNKHPQSVSHHKFHPSTITALLHYLYLKVSRMKSLCKQGTGDDLINTLYDLHYGLLLMSVPREGV